jgi:hypothetical protein
MDQPGEDVQQAVLQSRDHGLAAADTLPVQPPVSAGGGGELMQPPDDAGPQQRAPHPGPVDLLVARRQVAQGGAEFGVAEQVLDLGPVPVPVLNLRGLRAGGDIEVGDLCRARHKSPYAESRVMPRSIRSALVSDRERTGSLGIIPVSRGMRGPAN